MVAPAEVLAPLIIDATRRAFPSLPASVDPLLRTSRFADLQANVALALAARVDQEPRSVATRIAEELRAHGISSIADVMVSGPGYLNFTFSDQFLQAQLMRLAADPRLGVPVEPRDVIALDYSSPNVAKERHVGHLRTTIVGDCLARVLEHLGHRVIRQNHIGDWGTPFGMLIEHLLDQQDPPRAGAQLRTDPNAFYQAARRKFDSDPDFADRARVVQLQNLEPEEAVA